MENINSERLIAYQKSPFLSLIVCILLLIGCMILAANISGYVLTSATNLTQADILNLTSESNIPAKTKFVILAVQGITSLFTFILPAAIFFLVYNRVNFSDLTGHFRNHLQPYLLVVFILLSFFVVNTFFIDINSKMTLPSSFSEVEKVIRDLEDQLKEFTKILTQFDSPQYFILAVFVIAVIPAIGEELIFRGLLQNILSSISRNYHVAVWLSAIIFSGIHFQFYGFLPRMLLGALFGYLYVWSGNLLLSMLAHFLNNFISLTLLYIYQLNLTDIDVESEESLPIWSIAIFSFIFLYLLYSFRKYFSSLTGEYGKLE